MDEDAVDRLLMDHLLQAHGTPHAEINLDRDAIEDPVHGTQEGRYFHGFNGHYCNYRFDISLWARVSAVHLCGRRLST